MDIVNKFICKVLGHKYIKEIRHCSPGIGREEMRCERCDDFYLLEWENPKEKLITEDDRKQRLGLEN